MADSKFDKNSVIRTESKELPHVHRFGHEAMATVYEIFVQHPERDYARQAAMAAFEELDVQLLFDVCNLRRKARLAHMQAFRRLMEATGFGHRNNVLKLPKCWPHYW